MSRGALVADIWQAVFEDSPDFIALYRRTTYDARRVHLIVAPGGGAALSHVQYLRYRFRYKQAVWPAGYISGAATRPEARGRGLVHMLMRASHLQMWREGCRFAFLIPASEPLYAFYQKMGYATLFGRRIVSPLSSPPKPVAGEIACERFLRWQSSLSRICPTVCHTPAQWRTLVDSLHLERGGVAALPHGDCYYYHSETGAATAMLSISHRPAEELAGFDLEAPFAMLRPIDIPAVLSDSWHNGWLDPAPIERRALIAAPTHLVADLIDEHIPANTGRYLIPRSRGRVRPLFRPLPPHRLIRPITPDVLLQAIPPLRHTLVYGMME